ncbi:hypothetical protein ECANGB1_540 [Enterospora canceri]|uniref:Uncharacterized protein n=1 Tax=Enterospora canceri TaxID=1081671 RepID=A0A1Y1S7Z1_9MICR|nr:hypothetical protein ECANGB1_540 [Enterospora canceri]
MISCASSRRMTRSKGKGKDKSKKKTGKKNESGSAPNLQKPDTHDPFQPGVESSASNRYLFGSNEPPSTSQFGQYRPNPDLTPLKLEKTRHSSSGSAISPPETPLQPGETISFPFLNLREDLKNKKVKRSNPNRAPRTFDSPPRETVSRPIVDIDDDISSTDSDETKEATDVPRDGLIGLSVERQLSEEERERIRREKDMTRGGKYVGNRGGRIFQAYSDSE